MRIKDKMCYRKGKPKNSIKNLSVALQVENDKLVNKLDYKNTQKPSKLMLFNVFELFKL